MLNYFYNKYYFKYSINKRYLFSPVNILNEIRKTQFYDYDKLKKYRIEKLEKLLAFINKNSKFYLNKFNRAVEVRDILYPEIVTTKKEIIDNFDLIYIPTGQKEYPHITSGSTGEPLKIISSSLSESTRIAHILRFLEWWGIKPSSRNVLIWGKMKEDKKEKVKLTKKIRYMFFRRNFSINVFDLNRNTIRDYYREILNFKPYYIRGYTSAIYQLAKLIEESELNGGKLNIKVAIVTSEVLFEEQREYIRKILNCRVANEYGAGEIGLFAVQCPEGNRMHIVEELNYLTALKNNNLIVTDLHNRAMPLLNYNINDSVEISEPGCICGRGSRTISNINGRQGDFIKKENEELVSQYLIYYIFKDMEHLGFSQSVSKYKIIQRNLNFEIFIEKGKNYNEKSIEYLIKRMKEEIGNSISTSINFVDEIPRESSGKLRFFQRIK